MPSLLTFTMLMCLSAYKWRTILRIDLADLLFAIDVWLIKRIYRSSSTVITSRTEFTLDTAITPKRLTDDLLSLFTCRILDKN